MSGIEVTKRKRGGFEPGDALGDVTLLEFVARGSYAYIWKAWSKKDKREVAVRILRRRPCPYPDMQQRFFRGARFMERLKHSAVARVFEPERRERGRCFTVMEYLSGGSLRQRVLGQPPGAGHWVSWVIGVGQALEHMHQKGMLHLDLTPDNILLNGKNQPKLVDFDMIRTLKTEEPVCRNGTCFFAAPETWDRDRAECVASDVYALAMTLAFCFHGKPLGKDDLAEKDRFVARLDLDHGLKSVLLQAVSHDPVARYATMHQFLTYLKGYSEES